MYIKVRVQAGAKRESVEKSSEDSFKISVKEPAERNLANRRIAELLARQFGCEVKNVRLVNGHHSPSKIFSINL